MISILFSPAPLLLASFISPDKAEREKPDKSAAIVILVMSVFIRLS